MDGPAGGAPSPVAAWQHKLEVTVQRLLDRSTPHIAGRWAALGLVVLLYTLRVWYLRGFYIVTYALGIYNLNLLLGFLTPQVDPETEGPELPTKSDQEFRPFVRRLPEFKFWWSAMKSVLIGFLVTFFRVFDVPVFWPILLLYWFILFFLTMKRQIRHMIKYKYIPFSFGKKKYTGKSGDRRLDKDSNAADDTVTTSGHAHPAHAAPGQHPATPPPTAVTTSYAPPAPASAGTVTERHVAATGAHGAPESSGAGPPPIPMGAFPVSPPTAASFAQPTTSYSAAYATTAAVFPGSSFPAASPLNAGGFASPPASQASYGTGRPVVNHNYI